MRVTDHSTGYDIFRDIFVEQINGPANSYNNSYNKHVGLPRTF